MTNFLKGICLIIVSHLIVNQNKAIALPGYYIRIPNGSINTCYNCHFTATGGKASLNSFGKDFFNNGSNWDKQLAKLDSDNDGFSNGIELQDSLSLWNGGSIGDSTKVTLPGDPSHFPSSLEEVLALNNLTISPIPASNFMNFSIKTGIIGKLTVSIFEINGLLVNSFSSVNSNGEYNFGWNLMTNNSIPVESGFYFAEVKMNNFVERKRFLVAR